MKQRAANFEFLRIISMFSIVVIHSFVHGKVDNVNFNGNIPIMISLEAVKYMCYTGVNCFILISSYFLVCSPFKLNKLVMIWVQTVFWSVSLYLILNLWSFDFKLAVKALFPISFNQYWFVTQYIAFYLIFTYLSSYVEKVSKKQYIVFLIIILTLSIIWRNVYLVNATTCLDWFIVLFFVGGYIRRFSVKEYKWGSLFVGSVILWVLSYNVKTLFLYMFFGKEFVYGTWSLHYNSIPVVVSSVLLFLYFRNLKIDNGIIRSVILKFSPLMFGVYLVHDNIYIRNVLWSFLNLSSCEVWREYFLKWITSVFIIFLLSVFMEFCRMELFRLLYIEALVTKLINKCLLNFKLKKWILI